MPGPHSRSRPYHAPPHTSPFLLDSPSHSTTTSHQSAMDDDDVGSSSPAPPPPPRPTPTAAPHRTLPVREDCWSEEATATLVEAWGDRYVELKRGNLRQKDWQDVADAVNAAHGHVAKARRTDVQCKNRIDTLKKKYKVEKSKLLASEGGRYSSPWKFFSPMDSLLGPSFRRSTAPAPTPLLPWKTSPVLPPSPSSVPVGPRSKRPVPAGNRNYRRNFSADVSDDSTLRWRARNDHRLGMEVDVDGVEVYRELAEAITRFGKIYERVEEEKQRQMVELEKQKMQFAKDLELQRIKLFMESQVQFMKLNMSSKRTSRQSAAYRCNDVEDSPSFC